MKRRRRPSQYVEEIIGKARGFERVLHRSDQWLDSITEGGKILAASKSHPALKELRGAAKQALTELWFPPCTIFELYWLCCVFSDYETEKGFYFEKLTLPDWFPFPHGFEHCDWLDLRGKRIYPPEIWNEAKVRLKRERNTFAHYLQEPDRSHFLEEMVPDRDWIIVLPPDHPIRQLFRSGRPIKTTQDGETMMLHKRIKSIAAATVTVEPSKVKTPTRCKACGGNMLWDEEDKTYRCLLCGRE